MPLSNAARVIAATSVAPSYHGDLRLVAVNLFLMLAGTYLTAALLLGEGYDLWRYRRIDRWNHPITVHRLKMFFVGLAAFIRCGAEAASILGWDPRDPATGAVILNLKHYADPVSITCLFCWLTLHIMSKRSIGAQLRREPLPLKPWATMPQLVRPMIVLLMVAVAAFGVVYLRGR